jgi:hypothetical protein
VVSEVALAAASSSAGDRLPLDCFAGTKVGLMSSGERRNESTEAASLALLCQNLRASRAPAGTARSQASPAVTGALGTSARGRGMMPRAVWERR